MDLTVKEKNYLIFELSKLTTKDSRPYLRLVLSDDSGTLINGIMFDSNKLTFDPKKGDLVAVSATYQQYNNQSQLKVNEMYFVSAMGAEAFLPKSKQDPKEMAESLKQTTQKHVTDEWLSKLIETFYNDTATWERFTYMPAAKSMHHAYIHGLLEHTLGAVRIAAQVCPLYPKVNKDLVIAGALFHDIGKVKELDTSAGFEYSDEGKLLGHITQGYTMLVDYISTIEGFPVALRQHLLHMILSHHGSLEFGSPQVPKSSEAILLNFVDDMDAKLNAVSSILGREDIPEGGWSSYDKLLERQLYMPPKY
ncbi:MAG: HD domain-containing protein [Deferribacteraceae bacterium]|jgi:3'-5' exoribonuclease|nr:HD domain-containing protein [Deferribacteraceae bacterium]